MSSGYEISYEEFVSLLSETSIRGMVEGWFGGSLKEGELLKSSGETLSLEALHDAIQTNKEWQYKLYQAAMNIWR